MTFRKRGLIIAVLCFLLVVAAISADARLTTTDNVGVAAPTARLNQIRALDPTPGLWCAESGPCYCVDSCPPASPCGGVKCVLTGSYPRGDNNYTCQTHTNASCGYNDTQWCSKTTRICNDTILGKCSCDDQGGVGTDCGGRTVCYTVYPP